MKNSFLLTPFFLDRYSAELEALLELPFAAGWQLNRPALPEGEVQARMNVYQEPLAGFVWQAAAGGQRPVSIAGDCCTAIAFLAGLQRAGLAPVLVWLDAHGDFNTWETSPSGFLGGMPLAMLTGRGEQTLSAGVNLRPLEDASTLLCDGRDLDPGERRLLEESGVTHLTRLEDLLSHPLLAGRPLYIHYDTDIVNPDDAPAMSYRSPGGPRAEQVRAVFRALAQTGRVVGVSLSTWNPQLDADGRTRDLSLSLLFDLLGEPDGLH
jgi:arginase